VLSFGFLMLQQRYNKIYRRNSLAVSIIFFRLLFMHVCVVKYLRLMHATRSRGRNLRVIFYTSQRVSGHHIQSAAKEFPLPDIAVVLPTRTNCYTAETSYIHIHTTPHICGSLADFIYLNNTYLYRYEHKKITKILTNNMYYKL